MATYIEYALELPATKTGNRLAKKFGRMLKHVYKSRRLRIDVGDDRIMLVAIVRKDDLLPIRGALKMMWTSSGITARFVD